eukprot:Gregarina_sp_Pseudo_9__736@NODE_1470_length_1573_cov_73_943937_g340_i1_p1_GENE_NODE_1470_length_1573_cov_73_943937_g340_i1NODE_1470_length_1573_cov_73_943937_g340_i1_p1_ORF_typecomplete_len354_score29_09CENPB_dimeris/PF09026_10/4_9e03CENPB_dimeris/PF09026_10/0_059ANAPC15/PF15243_6/1_1GCIP/PF13324_6/5_2_NODE_1470_length_1573_cov_73_943937_g340_i11251186
MEAWNFRDVRGVMSLIERCHGVETLRRPYLNGRALRGALENPTLLQRWFRDSCQLVRDVLLPLQEKTGSDAREILEAQLRVKEAKEFFGVLESTPSSALKAEMFPSRLVEFRRHSNIPSYLYDDEGIDYLKLGKELEVKFEECEAKPERWIRRIFDILTSQHNFCNVGDVKAVHASPALLCGKTRGDTRNIDIVEFKSCEDTTKAAIQLIKHYVEHFRLDMNSEGLYRGHIVSAAGPEMSSQLGDVIVNVNLVEFNFSRHSLPEIRRIALGHFYVMEQFEANLDEIEQFCECFSRNMVIGTVEEKGSEEEFADDDADDDDDDDDANAEMKQGAAEGTPLDQRSTLPSLFKDVM